jgi:hypothetical protein
MEFKGTKGKWKIKKRRNNCFYIKAESWSNFCQVYTITDGGMSTNKEAKANALLISKAPEMLEMLKEIHSFLSSGTRINSDDIYQLIKEATEI